MHRTALSSSLLSARAAAGRQQASAFTTAAARASPAASPSAKDSLKVKAHKETGVDAELHENREYLQHEKNLRPIWTALRGRALLNEPTLNKGAGFTVEERDTFGLFGLLPHEVHTLEQQCRRAYSQLQERPSNIAKYT
ncbi:hypothetical protein JCM6882_003682, partial [Rhodosporidiobolus microsporus]